MFTYPPALPSTLNGPRSGDTSNPLCARKALLRKRLFDISIGLQSALTLAYTVELVYYFVRLKSISGVQSALWRAGLLMLLLIIDVVFIWLTVRSKNSRAPFFQPPVPPSVPPDTSNQANDVPLNSFNNNPFIPEICLSPYMDPNCVQPPRAASEHHQQQQIPDNNTRSHLNTPIGS